MSNLLPEQRNSVSAKKKIEWYKNTYDYYINLAGRLNDKDEVEDSLRAANGIIPASVFEYVLNPLGNSPIDLEKSDNTGKLPGELRNTDFITPIRERNIGEYIELPYKFFVKTNNPDAVMLRDIEVQDTVGKLMEQQFINILNENSVDTGVDSKPVPDFEVFAKAFKEEWFDERAAHGQDILNLLNDITDFDIRRYQDFYYWWATEEFYTYRYIRNNEVFVESISPLEGYPIPNGSQFVEDYEGFLIKRKITWNQFLDKYDDKISDKDRTYVQELTSSFVSTGRLHTKTKFLRSRFGEEFDRSLTGDENDLSFSDDATEIDENILIWKTEVPIKILKYVNLLGELLEVEVSDDYELDPDNGDVQLYTEWRRVVYTGVRIGDKDNGVYFPPEEELVQRYDKVSKTCKLPCGGKQGILQNIPRNPVPKRLIPYLAMDRILYLAFERALAKYKGNILLLPKSMMNPDEAGTTKQKYFYMYADGSLMYDDTIVDLNTVNQGFKVVGNMGLEKFLVDIINIRKDNKAEAWELANMNNERYGATANSQTVTNAQQNIYRAKLGSTLMITMFNAALQREHAADIEFSKYAWNNGKKGSYFDRSKNNMITVEVDPRDHFETDYGIFVRNSKAEESILEAYRELAFNASQNGDMELASEAIAADNVPELRQLIKKLHTANREFEQAMEKQKADAIKYAADKQSDDAALDREAQATSDREANETKVEVAWINAMGFNDETKGENTFSDADIVKLAKERREEFKLKLAERAQKHKEVIDKEKLAISRTKSKKAGK